MKNVIIFAQTVEQKALDQISLLASQPAFAGAKIRIMPDVHAGAGCVIGFTADLGDKVIPNVVGVDIGCGMLCSLIDSDYIVENDLAMISERLDAVIRAKVPSGFNVHENSLFHSIIADGHFLEQLYCYQDLHDVKRIRRSMGTLGGGNHFIELDTDGSGNLYLVIHTGSRNLGKQVAEIYQRLAIDRMNGKGELARQEKALIAAYKAEGRKGEISEAIEALRTSFKADGKVGIPNDLAFLTGQQRELYLHDMRICQTFAEYNRLTIMEIICKEMNWLSRDICDTIHNYIDHDSNIVRKGAVSAKAGECLIIPMNMRDGSLICLGKGNDDWNQSAPHGAGRLMSRTQARETLSLEEFKRQMNTVYSTSVCAETLDEAPMAYKPMDEIVQAIGDTVTIEKRIKPVYNFKAGE